MYLYGWFGSILIKIIFRQDVFEYFDIIFHCLRLVVYRNRAKSGNINIYINDDELSRFSHVRLSVCTRTCPSVVEISIWNVAWIIEQGNDTIFLQIVQTGSLKQLTDQNQVLVRKTRTCEGYDSFGAPKVKAFSWFDYFCF